MVDAFFAHRFNPQRSHEPQRRPVDESPNVPAPDQRNVLAKLFLKEFEQTPPVSRLLFPHPVKHRRSRGIIRPQSLSEVGIHTLVFFFQGNGQRQYFALRQVFELFHVAIAYLPIGKETNCNPNSQQDDHRGISLGNQDHGPC